jgi:uncharacterized protein YjbI with pentapeptide repeats
MKLVNAQPKHSTSFWLVSRPARGRWHATIVIKAAYRLVQGNVAVPDDDNPPTASGDDPSEPGTAPIYASDFVPHKPKTDFLVTGAAYPPGGAPVPACRVSIGIGAYAKSLAVFGDRHWQWGALGANPGEPAPFVSMPLGWERAFGGPESHANPAGRGADYSSGQPMPNVEHIDQRTTQSTHRPDPAGFGPLGVTWQPRIGKAGTYDSTWLETRWPWFPADFDWSFFNAAPQDQQFGHLDGDETLAFENMHPGHAIYRSRLPGVIARAFVQRGHPDEATFAEVPLKLDTVWIDVPGEKLILVWRGLTRVRSPRLREIEAIYTDLEPLDARNGIEIHHAAFIASREAADTDAEATAADPAIEKRREAAASQIAEAQELAASMRQLADLMMKATGLDKRRERAQRNNDDPMEALQKQIASLKAHDPVKGQQVEDQLLAIDRTLGEAMAKSGVQPPWTRERVADALAKGESLAKAKLDGLNLAALDFTGADLTDATLCGANLSDAILDNAILAGADLSKTVLTHTSLNSADLSRARFAEATVANTTFANARIENAVFAKLDLTGADFTGAAGNAADFTDSVLKGARFTNANLPRAQFSGVHAAGADFSNAELQASDFSEAKAPGIIMEGAGLTNLRASRGADFSDGRFARSHAPRSVWQQAVLDRADFERAVLSQAQFPEASLREAHFDRAHLDGVNFDDAILTGARITNANLLRASFTRADLTNAAVEGCNLYSAGLLDATLDGASFEGSMVMLTLLAR